jgi:hypothetical protein
MVSIEIFYWFRVFWVLRPDQKATLMLVPENFGVEIGVLMDEESLAWAPSLD